MTRRSYAQARSDTPLLGETIGECLRRTAAKFRDRPALVVRHQDAHLSYGSSTGA